MNLGFIQKSQFFWKKLFFFCKNPLILTKFCKDFACFLFILHEFCKFLTKLRNFPDRGCVSENSNRHLAGNFHYSNGRFCCWLEKFKSINWTRTVETCCSQDKDCLVQTVQFTYCLSYVFSLWESKPVGFQGPCSVTCDLQITKQVKLHELVVFFENFEILKFKNLWKTRGNFVKNVCINFRLKLNIFNKKRTKFVQLIDDFNDVLFRRQFRQLPRLRNCSINDSGMERFIKKSEWLSTKTKQNWSARLEQCIENLSTVQLRRGFALNDFVTSEREKN